MDSPRVIYITGTSFSGSTILGALLGLHPRSMCAGELSNWTHYHDNLAVSCSCGLNWQECSFWKEVCAAWLKEEHPGWQEYKILQNQFERMRAIPLLDLQQRLHPDRFATYAVATRRIYQILAQRSQKEIIFDISKKVGRGQALGRIGGLEIAYIHLVREGRGYLASTVKHMRRQQQRGGKGQPLSRLLLRSIFEWVLTNWMAEKMTATSGRPSLRIRYEDLASNPAGEINRIAAAFSLDMSAVLAGLRSDQPIRFGHMWGGNEIRLSGPVQLTLDESWRNNLPVAAERFFWVVAGKTSRHYGYSRVRSGV